MQLAPNLDLRAASGLHAEIVAARGTPLHIDASQVERLGGLCAQVLLAAQSAWHAEGNAFSIDNASEAFNDAARLLGVDFSTDGEIAS